MDRDGIVMMCEKLREYILENEQASALLDDIISAVREL